VGGRPTGPLIGAGVASTGAEVVFCFLFFGLLAFGFFGFIAFGFFGFIAFGFFGFIAFGFFGVIAFDFLLGASVGTTGELEGASEGALEGKCVYDA